MTSCSDTLPIGLIVFPGSGITENLADKARAMGIPLFDFPSEMRTTGMTGIPPMPAPDPPGAGRFLL